MKEQAPDPAIALLARWQEEHDPDALDELLRLELTILKRRLRAKGGQTLDGSISVSDIAQAAVVRLLEVEPEPRFPHPNAMRAYLWTAAWRLLIDYVRRPAAANVALDDAGSRALDEELKTTGGLDRVQQRERSVALDLALNLLRPAEQEILRMVYFEHMGIAGAAETLGLGRDVAKTRLVRARRRLAEKLRSWTELIDAA